MLQGNIPIVHSKNVSQLLDSTEIVLDTARQIMKDFGMFGITITFSGNLNCAYQELHAQLVDQITRLLRCDYGRLLSVLYQVDITDKDIAQSEAELPNYNHIEILAHQIIVRDLKKVLTRRYFSILN